MRGVITEVFGSRHYMAEVSGNLWKRHMDQLLSRADNNARSNSPSSIENHSIPFQLGLPVDFSDEVVPLTSGSHTATADESQLTSTANVLKVLYLEFPVLLQTMTMLLEFLLFCCQKLLIQVIC